MVLLIARQRRAKRQRGGRDGEEKKIKPPGQLLAGIEQLSTRLPGYPAMLWRTKRILSLLLLLFWLPGVVSGVVSGVWCLVSGVCCLWSVVRPIIPLPAHVLGSQIRPGQRGSFMKLSSVRCTTVTNKMSCVCAVDERGSEGGR